jgi:hypothetical protein
MTIPRHLKPESFESLTQDPSGQCFVDLDEVNEKLDLLVCDVSLEIERTLSALETEADKKKSSELSHYILGLSDCLRIIKKLK